VRFELTSAKGLIKSSTGLVHLDTLDFSVNNID
jgi:hypothetical protein